MNKIVISAALAFTLALLMSMTPATASWYRVNNPGSHVDMFENYGHPGKRGKLRCRIPHGEYLSSNNPSGAYRMVHVFWQKRLGTMEWHWKSAHNRWCPHWNRNGWVEKRLIRAVDKPGGGWIN